MKQTAVKFFEDQLKDKLGTIVINKNWELLEEIIDQAKAIEKKQIKDAFVECWMSNVPYGTECKLDAETYYNETFKSE